MRQYIVTRGG